MIIKSPVCIDISHWKPVADFNAISPRPVLIITKATEHTSFVDSTFTTYFPKMKQAGYKRGVYHFFRKAYNATEQARHFCNTIRPYVTQDDILILDFEEGGEEASQLIAFLGYVRANFPASLIMNYSRQNIMNTIPMTAAQASVIREYPSWIAGYPSNPDYYSTFPAFYQPNGNWGPVWLWQYTASGIVGGIPGETDCNWMHPDLVEQLGATTLPPEEGNAIMDKWKVTWLQGCNTRPEPNVNNTYIATLPTGYEFDSSIYFVPAGKTPEQERWAQLESGHWVALVYSSQPRCALVTPAPTPEPTEDEITVDVEVTATINGKVYTGTMAGLKLIGG